MTQASLTEMFCVSPTVVRFDFPARLGTPPDRVEVRRRWYRRTRWHVTEDRPTVGLVWYERLKGTPKTIDKKGEGA